MHKNSVERTWQIEQPSDLFREGNGTPLQYSCLENSMDGEAWWAAVHGVAKTRTRLGDFPFTFHCHALEKEMATHSSVLAWRIPGTGEPGGLPSMGSHRVRHDWRDLTAAAADLFRERSQSFKIFMNFRGYCKTLDWEAIRSPYKESRNTQPSNFSELLEIFLRAPRLWFYIQK